MSHKHIKMYLSLVTSSVEWGRWTQRSQRHIPLQMPCYPMSLPGHLVEKHLPPVNLHWNGDCKNANNCKSQQSCCLPFYPNPWYLFTCSSNWKFFSKTRSMWSRKAECSCCCSFSRLSFNMKRKIRQVVERLPKQGWSALLKQHLTTLLTWLKVGCRKNGPSRSLLQLQDCSHETILNLQRQRIRPLSKFPMLISFLALGLSDCGLSVDIVISQLLAYKTYLLSGLAPGQF